MDKQRNSKQRKPTPLPFTVVVDTREQIPWGFPEDTLTVTKKLNAGDYSILGYENVVAIERKSLNDLINTVIHGRRRFMHELERLETVAYRCVAIEGTVGDVLAGKYNSDAFPQSIIGSILWFERFYGVPFHWWHDRQIASYMGINWLRHVYKVIAE